MVKIFSCLFFILSLNVFAQKTKDEILGKWMSTDKSVAVEVYREGNTFKAKVIWFDERLGNGKPMNERRDRQNPDPKLRNRKVIGMDILQNLDYNPQDHRWENGKIYDASSGRIWDTFAEINEEGKLCVRGFWKFTWIGKSLYFNRL